MARYLAGVLVLAAAAIATGGITVYTDEAAFQAAIGGSLIEDFDGYDFGDFTGSSFYVPGGPKYGGTIRAEGPVNSTLFSIEGAMSTYDPNDWLRMDFDHPDLVQSTGGWYYARDANGNYTSGEIDITIKLQNDPNTFPYSFAPADPNTFRGFVTTGATMEWITIDAPDTGALNWSTMDHLLVDSPEPASLTLLALGGLALLRRR